MSDTTESRAWYQEPMVLLVVAIPATAVIVGMAFLATAISTWDGLVVDDYYKQGKEINRRLERDERARLLGLAAVLSEDSSTSELVVDFNALGSAPRPAVSELQLRFVHRTRSNLDVSYTLTEQSPGRFVASGSIPKTGLWSVLLEAPEWRLVRRGLAQPGKTLVLQNASEGGY